MSKNVSKRKVLAIGLLAAVTFASPAQTRLSADPTYGLQYCNDRPLTLADLQPDYDHPEFVAMRPEKTQWYPGTYGPKFVALVVHGLNNRPSKMADVRRALNTLGGNVLQVGLPGHRGYLPDDGSNPYTAWTGHLRAALCLAQQQAKNKKIPFVFVGYSLSGALYLDILGQNTEPIFKADAQVLFAPALSLRWTSYLVKAFFLFGEEYYLNSWSPETYRMMAGAKMKHYKGLFRTIDSLHHHVDPKIHNIPTLVIMDPKDELVSLRGIKKFVSKNKLTHWQINEVDNSESNLKDKLHHLVTSQEAVGPNMWSEIRRNFLNHIYQSTGMGEPPLPETYRAKASQPAPSPQPPIKK